MAAAHAKQNAGQLQAIVTQSAHGSLWPTLLITITIIGLGTPLLSLFGEGFASAYTTLVTLTIANTVAVMLGPVQDVLLMTGRQAFVPRVLIYSVVVHISLLCLLVPMFGIAGAAVASLASSLMTNLWLMLLVHRKIGIGTTVLYTLARVSREEGKKDNYE